MKKGGGTLLTRTRREMLHVTTRNKVVQDDLQKAYRNKIPTKQLTVFCVGKTYYWSDRDSPKDKSADRLNLSGVIQLRRHCMSIVSEAQYQAATRYMETQVPAALNLVQLWVQSGSGSASAERKQATLDALDKMDKSLRTVRSYPPTVVLAGIILTRHTGAEPPRVHLQPQVFVETLSGLYLAEPADR